MKRAETIISQNMTGNLFSHLLWRLKKNHKNIFTIKRNFPPDTISEVDDQSNISGNKVVNSKKYVSCYAQH